MKYYVGAYYFLKLKEIEYGGIKGSKIHTCSRCINDSYLDSWSISWAEDGKKIDKRILDEFKISRYKLNRIHNWTDDRFEEENIGWINTFSNLETIKEYKAKFFNETKDFEVLSISFSESEFKEALKLLKPNNSEFGDLGIYNNLKKELIEEENQNTIGYDLIGIESGGDFHSFHCHDLSTDLINQFNIEINDYGLIKENDKWQEMVDYMNDEVNGFEPVPWFYVKVNIHKID